LIVIVVLISIPIRNSISASPLARIETKIKIEKDTHFVEANARARAAENGCAGDRVCVTSNLAAAYATAAEPRPGLSGGDLC